jgi:aquaporin TIP
MQLGNVRHPEDAERAKLRDKSDLRVLNLSWGLQGEEGKSVLEKLIPPRSLEHFVLHGYMSKDFPNWMSHISTYLPSLTFLALYNLGTCDNLPPFGQLPNLRSLVMRNSNIVKIGKEFYGEGRTCRKLRYIGLKSMENLVEWWTTQSGEENEESLIPNLHQLDIADCPNLKFLPYPPRSMFWCLDNSSMVLPKGGFGKVSSSALPFEMIVRSCNFAPEKWDRFRNLPTLEIFRVMSCNGLRALPEVFRCFTSLTKLHLYSLKDLETLPEWLGNLTSLECFFIVDCPNLTYLPESIQNLTALRDVSLMECNGLNVLKEWLGKLNSLERFGIINCPNLTRLPESIQNLTSLKKFCIWGCPSLVERCEGEDAHLISQIPEVVLLAETLAKPGTELMESQ